MRRSASVSSSGESGFARTAGGETFRDPRTTADSSGNRASVVWFPRIRSGVGAIQ
jgi:hypothetical protein